MNIPGEASAKELTQFQRDNQNLKAFSIGVFEIASECLASGRMSHPQQKQINRF